MSDQAMSKDRQIAVRMLQNMGWTAERKPKGLWKFSRPDTGGLWDTMNINQSLLSPRWAVSVALRYGDAPDLLSEIRALEEAWIADRFKGLLQEFRHD
jgi:hypothetical protein